jgi:hypothetical protein
LDQDGISHIVTEGVVDRFKVIDIDHPDGNVKILPLRVFKKVSGGVKKVAATQKGRCSVIEPGSFAQNGPPAILRLINDRPLLWVLCTDLGLPGTKFGCGEGLCGGCTVPMGNEAVPSSRVTRDSYDYCRHEVRRSGHVFFELLPQRTAEKMFYPD